jgi:hypothetical protein
MSFYPNGLQSMRTPPEADQAAALEELAASFALRDRQESEELIESFCCEAIRQWRLKDATFWQRVKFRARMLRAMTPDPRLTPIHPEDRWFARSRERNV